MAAFRFPRAACVASLLLAACSGSGTHTPASPPPRAEFLLGAADSTLWVATTSGEMHVRAAPLIIAKFGGRFYEVYAHHEDFSYSDAELLGDRLYKRDLLTGDSTLVLADVEVPRIAREYAAAHPDERPLAPNEDGDPDPATSVTAEFDILDVYGPLLSYEYHLDVTYPGKRPWHTTRQGVLDLRTGRVSSVADLFGKEAGARLTSAARKSYAAIRDSIARARPSLSGDDRRAALALEKLQFDETSFTLSAVDGRLSVTFGVPGHGEGPAGSIVQLEPLSVDSVSWWKEFTNTVPARDEADNDRWHGRGYQLLARYDTSGEIAQLSLADSAKREWPVIAIRAPLFQVIWLDDPPVREEERQALTRAFNHAASYDEGARVALRGAPNSLVSLTHASQEIGQRKPARIVGAHDAPACEQHGPCVRRRHSVDDGQVRRDRRVSSRALGRRDGLDRSGRLSRADSPGRPGGHESECQLCGPYFHGSGCPRRGRGPSDRSAPAHKLLLFDVRCR